MRTTPAASATSGRRAQGHHAKRGGQHQPRRRHGRRVGEVLRRRRPRRRRAGSPARRIQCERCHGTGLAADVSNGGHWNAGVKIVGFDTPAMNGNAKAASTKILDSQVCGQCHGSFKSGNVYGFTPDTTIRTRTSTQYTLADVPSEASFTANPGAYRFFPSGQNKATEARLLHRVGHVGSLAAWRAHDLVAERDALPADQESATSAPPAASCATAATRVRATSSARARPIMSNFTESTTNEGQARPGVRGVPHRPRRRHGHRHGRP